MKAFILIIGFITFNLCYAEDWKLVVESTDNVRTYLDIETLSYHSNDNSVSVWSKVNNIKEQLDSGILTEYKTLDYYFCSSRTSTTVKGIAYDKQGNIIEISDSIIGPNNIVSGSVEDTVFNYVCKKPKLEVVN
ncbi:surface-adhesin E family protein [Acinetobacter baumannii]|uniref:surface-adhesin E family protein n=1 Tax=Acinetobacter baumannii TaxID=470 RepID=UPI0012983E6E|nr:surface-adhesin E family protein [Acinetobacter baumannii]EKV4524759.1 hypothetical protein [Acinetobacter baumannii]MDC4779676.1 hypothetical protein [Acinetobacter baumannii]MDC4843896.1 hypothetical protein [Acinetobacter baumannii]MDC5097959.1 hypothetical protein [Acinetobacter baumannii]MDK2102560.1 hypothetical protein [Acinetobacter baumannii]